MDGSVLKSFLKNVEWYSVNILLVKAKVRRLFFNVIVFQTRCFYNKNMKQKVIRLVRRISHCIFCINRIRCMSLRKNLLYSSRFVVNSNNPKMPFIISNNIFLQYKLCRANIVDYYYILTYSLSLKRKIYDMKPNKR